MELISIIIPIYNAEQYLDRCIQSVVSQTYSNIEIILVDDGSTDSTAAICLEWEKRDKRIVFCQKTNGGVSSARNEGLRLSHGTYFTFVDADDYVSKIYCENLLSHINASVDMVVLGMVSFCGESYATIRNRLKTGLYSADELKKYMIDDGTMSGFTIQSPCSVLYRKVVAEKSNVGFRENIRYNEDGLFNTEYLFSCKNQVYIDFFDVVYYYRENVMSSSLSANLLGEKYIEDMYNIEKILYEYNNVYPQYNIEKQIMARHVTLGLSSIMYAIRNDANKDLVLTIINRTEFRKGLKHLNFHKMSKLKKCFYFVLLTKNAYLIQAILKYGIRHG